MTVVCKECNTEKDIAEFSKQKRNKGLSMYCPNRNMEVV